MSSVNDVTGDVIWNDSKGDFESYSKNFDRIFENRVSYRKSNPRDFTDGDSEVSCEVCGKDFMGMHTQTKCGLCDI